MSWQEKMGKQMIRCRLDGALVNEDWHMLFPCSSTESLGMVGSDRPVVATTEDKVPRKKGQLGVTKDEYVKRVYLNLYLWMGLI